MAEYAVDPITQKSLKLCWEACGKMMWMWRYRNDAEMRARYALRTDPILAKATEGLDAEGLTVFFRSRKNAACRFVPACLVMGRLDWRVLC